MKATIDIGKETVRMLESSLDMTILYNDKDEQYLDDDELSYAIKLMCEICGV